MLLLIFGSIASASIVLIRHFLVGNPQTGENVSLSEISLMDNYEASFYNKEIYVGMDLGNVAIGIDVLSRSTDVDYGITYIWDNFIQNYVPRRLVGEDVKESLKIKLVKDEKIIDNLTYGNTTMTGYCYAYRSFNVFAPLLFLFIVFLVLP